MPSSFDFETLTNRFFDYYSRAQYPIALNLLNREASNFTAHASLTTYWRMAVLARMADAEGALHVFESALSAGYWYNEGALPSDPDFECLVGNPKFNELLSVSKDMRTHARATTHPERIILEPSQGARRPWPMLLVLHGNGSNAAGILEHWRPAVSLGWLVVALQSSQLSWLSDHYVWDNMALALTEIQQHFQELADRYIIDPSRVVLAGFSKGGHVAIQAAAAGVIPNRGFVAFESIIPDKDKRALLAALVARRNPRLRGYLLAGRENTQYYREMRQILNLIQTQGITCRLEATSNDFHAFPPGFGTILAGALEFVCGSVGPITTTPFA